MELPTGHAFANTGKRLTVLPAVACAEPHPAAHSCLASTRLSGTAGRETTGARITDRRSPMSPRSRSCLVPRFAAALAVATTLLAGAGDTVAVVEHVPTNLTGCAESAAPPTVE